MARFNLDATIKQLDAALETYTNAVNRTLAYDHGLALDALEPGEPAPAMGTEDSPLTETGKEGIRQHRATYTATVDAIAAAARRDLAAYITTPPSGNALAALEAMKGRSNVTADELDAIIELYGSSYQVRAIVADIARKSDAIDGADRPRLTDGFNVGDMQPLEAFDRLVKKYRNALYTSKYGRASMHVFDGTVMDRAGQVLRNLDALAHGPAAALEPAHGNALAEIDRAIENTRAYTGFIESLFTTNTADPDKDEADPDKDEADPDKDEADA